jgi:hypothetical protein
LDALIGIAPEKYSFLSPSGLARSDKDTRIWSFSRDHVNQEPVQQRYAAGERLCRIHPMKFAPCAHAEAADYFRSAVKHPIIPERIY